jgi:hypothetical protein
MLALTVHQQSIFQEFSVIIPLPIHKIIHDSRFDMLGNLRVSIQKIHLLGLFRT